MNPTSWEKDIINASESGRMEPGERQWQNIRRRMRRRSRRKSRTSRITWMSIAAGLAVLILFTAWFVIPDWQRHDMHSEEWEQLPPASGEPSIVSRTIYSKSYRWNREKHFDGFEMDSAPGPKR